MSTIEKLKILARIVNDVPEERFDMETFVTLRRDCGSTCCALGALAMSDEGEAMGLHVQTYNSDSPCLNVIHIDGDGNIVGAFDAGAKALGITNEQAFHLFSPTEYRDDDEAEDSIIDKIDVIERIEDMIWELENPK